MDSQEGVFTNKVPMLKLNEFDMWKIRIRQYMLLTDYAMWEVVENGPGSDEAVPEGAVRPPPITDSDRKRSKPVKSSLINEDLEQISADDLEETDIKWQMAMLTMRIKRFIKRTGRNNFGMKRDDGAGFDKSKVRCYKCNELGHFARECKGNSQQHNNQSKFNKSTNGSTSQALVSQEGFGFDWSDQAEENIQNQALMAQISETSSSEIPTEVTSKLCSKACIDTIKKYRDHNQNMSDSIKRSELEKVRTELKESKADIEKFSKASKAMDETLKARVKDDLKRGIGYKNTPPPYNNNYIPPKSNLANRLDTQDLKPGVTKVDPVEGLEVEDLGEEGETRKKEKNKDIPDENHILTNEKGGRAFMKSNSVDKGKGNTTASISNTTSSITAACIDGTTYTHTPLIVTIYSSHAAPNSDHLLKSKLTKVNYVDEKGIPKTIMAWMTGIMSFLEDLKRFEGGHVAFGDNPKGGKISGKGKVSKGLMTFNDVYSVEQLKHNLLSVSQVCDKKHNIFFNDEECLILSPEFKIVDENMILLRAPRKDNVYYLELEDVTSESSLNYLLSKASLSESSLWHRRMCHMKFKNMNRLVKGKQHKSTHKSKEVNKISAPLQLLHMDLFGPTNAMSIGKKSYCLVIVDDYSRFTWKQLILLVMLKNKVLVVKSKGKTPYELFEKKKPFIGFLKPFGCPCTILNTKSHLSMFESKYEDGFLVGYSSQSKALRVFNSSTRIIEESDNVKCNENTPNVPGTGPNWLFDIDSLTNSLNISYAVDTGSSADKATETGTPFVMFPMPTVDPIEFYNADKEPEQESEGDLSQKKGEEDQNLIQIETQQEDSVDDSSSSDLIVTNIGNSRTNVVDLSVQTEDHDAFESNLGVDLPD
ncbi:hypothetical protein OSB04_001863 [Centaurea solstitialis]|uniref:CCHC-type domain-containing protein n=1 Tax=Centaurea solstitialis TaxID=347529 RepID=A0AA38WM59_9ASTR|nr:hypothetical protein OSB04_001863 [Centaurea solstitialis]